MPDGRKVAIAIGVSDARPLTPLTGAVNGARDFGAWATKLGYESVVVTDEAEPVTIDRIRATLEEKLTGAIHRMCIYFAGHGLIRNAEERLWLLSDWYSQQRALAAEVLRRRLYYYGVEQLAIFADCCSSLPPNMDSGDLALDPVLGRGPAAMTEPALDKFWAQPDGAVTYMVQGETPEEDRCVFTGVLMEGLWGMSAEAFSPQSPKLVTSQSLAAFLRKEVPDRARRYNFKLFAPSISPTFPPGDDIYFAKDPPIPPPVFAPWPIAPDAGGPEQGPSGSPQSALPSVGRTLNFSLDLDGLPTPSSADFDSDPEGSGVDGVGIGEVSAPAAPEFLRRLQSQSRPTHFETDAGFAIDGKPVRDLWTADDVFAERDGSQGWWRIGSTSGYQLSAPAPFLIEFEDDTFAAATAVPRFIGALLCSGSGGSGLIYRPIGSSDEPTAGSEKAIAAMEDRALSADDVVDRAVDIRQSKHRDLTLGVIAAYLYDSIGDIESIRRMASYYVGAGQPIPYDIAFLGSLRGSLQSNRLFVDVPAVAARLPRTQKEEVEVWTHEATAACSGEVAGFWPWMRQGWPFLDDPSADGSTLVLPGLMELNRNLSSARFASLDKEGGQALAKLFKFAAASRRTRGAVSFTA